MLLISPLLGHENLNVISMFSKYHHVMVSLFWVGRHLSWTCFKLFLQNLEHYVYVCILKLVYTCPLIIDNLAYLRQAAFLTGHLKWYSTAHLTYVDMCFRGLEHIEIFGEKNEILNYM